MNTSTRSILATLSSALLGACGSSGLGLGEDSVGPTAGIVADGPGTDLDVQTSRTAVAANWSGFKDDRSGVARYAWAIGSSPGATDVQDWTDLGMVQTATNGNLDLALNAHYFVSVRAWDAVGNAGAIAVSNGVRVVQSSSPALPRLSEEAVQLAISSDLIWFDETLSGGAHTWIFNGGEFGKAAVAFSGDARADAKLLDQIRHLLIPGNGLTATGGFQDQKQLGTTSMFVLVRNTPRVWQQLSATEHQKIETMVYGALVSAAFTTSDHNPFVKANSQEYAMNGGNNLSRDWNPNYRNGMVGTAIVAAQFFGADEAQRRLKSHDHQAFVASLPALGLTNLHKTYTNSRPTRPTAAQVDATLHQDYAYYGMALRDAMAVYLSLTEYTYNRNVQCGLNNGQGRVGSNSVRGGYVMNGCASLPNKGRLGMLTEFDSQDAGGPRSSAHYSNDGWYVNNYIHYVLLALDQWQDSSRAQAVLQRIAIGTEDLLFKIDPTKGGGYQDFIHGRGISSPYTFDDGYGHRINRSIADAIQRAHQ